MKTLLKSPFNISLKVNNHFEIQNKEGFPPPPKAGLCATQKLHWIKEFRVGVGIAVVFRNNLDSQYIDGNSLLREVYNLIVNYRN